ncbi:MAG TPA: response regulator [Pyrinomonadaceae bacterium]|jgi:DNA-binding response OmpR family regulator|nr:response regulator [Pyrinomonadaceae bacterium]
MPPDKRRILCAETHEDTCSLITLLLERQGHEVKTGNSIGQCLELASHERFDLYLLDDSYPDGTSIELCKKLRALDPQTPILFFSSACFEKDIREGLEAGAQAYLTKPGDILQVAQTIKALLKPYSTDATRTDLDRR